MKKELTLATSDFERFRKPTRREKFLAEMNTVVPWAELVAPRHRDGFAEIP